MVNCSAGMGVGEAVSKCPASCMRFALPAASSDVSRSPSVSAETGPALLQPHPLHTSTPLHSLSYGRGPIPSREEVDASPIHDPQERTAKNKPTAKTNMPTEVRSGNGGGYGSGGGGTYVMAMASEKKETTLRRRGNLRRVGLKQCGPLSIVTHNRLKAILDQGSRAVASGSECET